MKPNRSILILTAASMMVGLLGGVVIQKFFPLGRTIQKVKQIAGFADESTIDEAFSPVSPPPEDSIRALAEQMTVSPIPGAIAERRRALKDQLRSNLPLEVAFRRSEASVRILDELRGARREGKIAETEYRHDRVFKRIEMIRFDEEDDALPESLHNAAARIAEFSELLAENGTHLIYSPAPNPLDAFFPMLAGEHEYRSISPLRTRFLLELLDREVDVVDLRPELGDMALSGRLPYHRFDHHWTPAGNEFAATIVSREINARFDLSTTFANSGALEISYRWIPIEASDWNLSLAPPETDPGTLFGREVLQGGAPIRGVPSSPLWVMGDSMLLESSPARSGLSADFGSHLSGSLRAPVNTLGRPGTADIRAAYFLNSTLTNSAPKILVWVHADNEFLDLPAIQADALTAASESISGNAKVLEVTPLPNPKQSPYPDAIFSYRVELQLPRDQKTTAIVYSWGFRKRTLSSIAGIKAGDERMVTLKPWSKAVESDPSLGTARVIDQLDNLEGHPVFWLDIDS